MEVLVQRCGSIDAGQECSLLLSGSLSLGREADTLKDLARRRCAGGVVSPSSARSAAPAPAPARTHHRSDPRPEPTPNRQVCYLLYTNHTSKGEPTYSFAM